ncbi:MAG: VOC family protein [Alphaproteobacteria bacterium]|nr:VOC family protein [Alphaproteobacteria bacterium]
MTADVRLTPELLCTDIDRSLAFYTGILGFSIAYQRPEEGFAMLERQGVRLMLDQMDTGADSRTWAAGPLDYPFGRGMNLQIQTTDVAALYNAVQDAVCPVFLPLEEKWYRADNVYVGNRQFIVLDPDGYMLRFFEDAGVRAAPP